MTSGKLKLRVDGKLYTLDEGDWIFINRNLLHITTEISDRGRYLSFNFPNKVVSFFSGSTMEENFVLPYVGNYGIPVVEFKRTTSWQKEILDTLLEMEILFKRRREKRPVSYTHLDVYKRQELHTLQASLTEKQTAVEKLLTEKASEIASIESEMTEVQGLITAAKEAERRRQEAEELSLIHI